MAYKFKTVEKMIGIFIVAAGIILIASIIFIAKGQKLFVKKNHYSTVFNSADNLTEGMPIKFKGLKIGSVKSMELNEENKIMVQFTILREYANRIKTDSIIKVNAPLIGEKILEITEGTKEAVMAVNNSPLYSIDSEKGRELLKAQLSQQAATPTDLIVQNVQLLTAQLSDPDGGLMKTLRNMEKFSSAFASTYGDNKDVITDMIKNLQQTTKNINDLSLALKNNPFFSWGGNQSPDQQKKKGTDKK
ncbi:MAG: MlaD family protein [bacterium]|nr:MlaD family protein [bacterium]